MNIADLLKNDSPMPTNGQVTYPAPAVATPSTLGPSMAEVISNRDLYCFVAGLVKERSECSGTLQSYLENLHRLGRSLRDRETVSPQEFAELLRAAFNPEISTVGVRSWGD